MPEAQSHKEPWDWQGLAREAKTLRDIIAYGGWEDLIQGSTLGQALRGLL